MKKSDLPKPLQTLLDISKVNMVKIDLSKKANDFISSLDSKIGGVGYLPMGEKYPAKADGTPLVMLAQINFKDLAQQVDIGQLPHPLPKQGILQIYIDGKDDDYLYGCDFDNFLPHDGYQVRFWQDDALPFSNDELNKVSEQLKNLDTDCLPFDFSCQYEMNFVLQQQSCHGNCFEYHTVCDNIAELKGYDIWNYLEDVLSVDDPDDYLECYDELSGNSYGQHLILGYPNFTQTDPREYNKQIQRHILLFQIETDDDNDIMWGDAGVANFFIHPDDLKNQDFSKLLYNWDCH